MGWEAEASLLSRGPSFKSVGRRRESLLSMNASQPCHSVAYVIVSAYCVLGAVELNQPSGTGTQWGGDTQNRKCVNTCG